MLDRAELEELASMNGKSLYVSFYLNVDPLLNRGGDYDIHFKNMLKDAETSLDRAVHGRVKGDLRKIKEYVSSNRPAFKKGLVLISSAENDVWRVYHLGTPVKNELVVATTPYTKPLLDVLDNHEKYVVLLVEKKEARLFVVHMGEIVEYGEVRTEDVPGKHKKEGHFALAQLGITRHTAQTGKSRLGVTGYRGRHMERHIEEHVKVHLTDVIDKLDELISNERVNRVVIGGSDEAVATTSSMLRESVRSKVVGTMKAAMFETPDEVLRKAEQVAAAFERKQEEDTVEALITEALKGTRAVIGLEDTLAALQEQRVMKLVLLSDVRAGGYVCGTCDFLSINDTGKCLSCRGEISFLDNIVDRAGEMALQQGAAVEVVPGNERLAKFGGIGAFLRY